MNSRGMLLPLVASMYVLGLLPAIKYQVSEVEHTLIYTRRNSQEVNFCASHIPGHEQEFTLTIFDTEDGEVLIDKYEQTRLSLEEAKFLRNFLNRSEISAILSQQQP
jgi:hypothetical protein